MILRFNEDIVKQGVALHPSAYLFNLYRREPEPLEDARYSELLAESRLFLADLDRHQGLLSRWNSTNT